MRNRLHGRITEQARVFRVRRAHSYDHQSRWLVEARQNGHVLPEVSEIPIPVLEGNGEQGQLVLKINNGKERG